MRASEFCNGYKEISIMFAVSAIVCIMMGV